MTAYHHFIIITARPLDEWKETAIMAASKPPPKTPDLVAIGSTAPAWNMPDQTGRQHRLRDYKGRWVVLYFYPKDDTPGCTKEACQFRDALSRFKRGDAAVLGISPDAPASHEKFRVKFDLNFDLLADVGSGVCKKYGVWQSKSMYGRSYMGVVRTTYLIDPNGKVAHRWDKVKVDEHDAEVLEKIKQLKRG